MNLNEQHMQKIKIYALYLCLFLSSVILLLLYNGDSPLYYFNAAPDNTVYKSVAKRMMQGDVLYRNIYEHKGIYLYFYYMLKELTNPFIIELLLDWCFVFFVYKSLRIFQNNPCAFLCTVFVNTMDKSFGKLYHFGGQSETIGRTIIIIIIYLILKNYYIYKAKQLKKHICFIIGILTMIICMIKYTMCIFVIAFGMTVYIVALKDKNVKKVIPCLNSFCAGIITGFAPAFIYFVTTGSLLDFIKIYFFDVSFKYKPADINVWPIVFFTIIIITILFIMKRHTTPISMLLTSCGITLAFTAVALRCYYFGAYIPFAVVALITIDTYIQEIEKFLLNSSIIKRVLAFLLYIGVIITLPIVFSADMNFMTKDGFSNVVDGCDGSLMDVADIINASDDKSFISRTDNCIIYLLTDTLPDTMYFINYNMVLEQHTSAYANSRYKEWDNYVNQAFNQYINDGSHNYILQYPCNYINKNLYEKVGTFCSNGNYGKTEFWILYKRK